MLPVLSNLLSAQSNGGAPQTPENILGRAPSSRRSSTTFGQETAPVERSVDPDHYLLGPSDQLIVSIPALDYLSDGGEFPVIVSADNIVGLPRGIAIDVRGMTLNQFRREVESAYRRRGGTLAQDLTITLVRPRSIYVTVKGDVPNPDRFVLTAADRVTTALDMASEIEPGSPEWEMLETARATGQLEQERTGSRRRALNDPGNLPLRHVTIRHNDGTSSQADLVRYQAYGRTEDNPTLREGDEVFVRKTDPTIATVAVGGAVNTPIAVPWAQGDNALMLLRLAAGPHPQAQTEGAYIARGGSDAGQETVSVNLRDTAALASILLRPGDRLIVPFVAGRSGGVAGFVTVRGAVNNPSVYPVVSGRTRLSEVIAAAGGFSADASLNGAFIARSADPEQLHHRSTISDPVAGISSSSLTLEDTLRFKYDQELHLGRVSADFVGLFGRGDSSLDVAVRGGDEIVVPRNPRSIYVSGRVLRPGAVEYREGAGVEYYVERAGGYTSAADADRTQVIKFGTGQMIDAEVANVLAGDEIYVPGERDTPVRTSLEQTQTVLAITAGLAGLAYTVVLIINELKK
jgi:protein involved in polysaccharide export with SLBB domain